MGLQSKAFSSAVAKFCTVCKASDCHAPAHWNMTIVLTKVFLVAAGASNAVGSARRLSDPLARIHRRTMALEEVSDPQHVHLVLRDLVEAILSRYRVQWGTSN